ncbi:hypothetical protein ACFQ51_37335 [Streptomyces kaempferi]
MLTLEEARATALVPVDVPASGLTSFRVAPSDSAAAHPTASAPATATDRTLSNGLVEVTVAADGTLDVTGADGTVLRGVGRLVDGGDRGDSYNYAPPARDVLVSEPTEIATELLEDGPLRSRIRVTRVYEWPAALSCERDVRDTRTVPTPVETLVEVRVGEPFVRVSTSFLNQSADHRLRFHVPLPEPRPGPRPPDSSPSPSAGSPPRRLGRVPDPDLPRERVRVGQRRQRPARPRHRVRTRRRRLRTRHHAAARDRLDQCQHPSPAGRARGERDSRTGRAGPRRARREPIRRRALGDRVAGRERGRPRRGVPQRRARHPGDRTRRGPLPPPRPACVSTAGTSSCRASAASPTTTADPAPRCGWWP